MSTVLFLFKHTSYNEVYNIIYSIEISTSTGHDKMEAYFIRIACEVLTPYITQLCCLSYEYGIFPNCLKIAKVIPIFKNVSKSEVTNY